MRVQPNLRLETLEIVGMLALFVAAIIPRRRCFKAEEDVAPLQALELRTEQGNKTRTLRLPLPLVIGRAADATLVLTDVQVSRMHARIEMVDGTLFLRDLGSRNGTLLNARPIEAPVPLREGDEIDVGEVRIVVGGVDAWT